MIGQIDGVLMASLMVGYDGHRGSVNYLAVDPDHSGVGYGKNLMAESERLLTSVGCLKINLCVRTDSDRAVKLYRQLGYEIELVHFRGQRLIQDG